MILGLTGFSGAGKSTVAEILKENGFYHLDCDALVHHEVYRDPAVLAAVEAAFGGVVKNGVLDRPALRTKTMGNREALKKLIFKPNWSSTRPRISYWMPLCSLKAG